MWISRQIYQEIKGSFQMANSTYYESNKEITRAVEVYNKLHRRSDILEGYLVAVSKNPHLKWESYINKYYSPVETKKLKNYIEKEIGVSVQDTETVALEQQNKINEMTELLLKFRGQSAEEGITLTDDQKRRFGRHRNLSMTLRHPASEFSVLFPRSKGSVSVY